MCVHVHMHMYMQGAQKARRGCWIPWNWSYKTLGPPRAASALVSGCYNTAVTSQIFAGTAAVWFLSSELTALRGASGRASGQPEFTDLEPQTILPSVHATSRSPVSLFFPL